MRDRDVSILLVTARQALRREYERALSEAGCACETTSDAPGADARLAGEAPVDAVLVDRALAQDDFLAVTRRAPGAHRDAPVIVVDDPETSRRRVSDTAGMVASLGEFRATGLARKIGPLVGETMQRVEDELIEATIRACAGSIPRAADMLGVSASTIYRRRGTAKPS